MIPGVKSIAYEYFHNFKPIECPIFKKDDLNILKNLGKNKDLVIRKPGKGNGIVIQNRRDYVKKTNIILNAYTKFKKVPRADPFYRNLLNEDKVKTSNFEKKEKIQEKNIPNVMQVGSSPHILYGLPKIHKCNVRAT